MLSTGDDFRPADQFQRFRVGFSIRGNIVHKCRPAGRDIGVHEYHDAMPLGGFTTRNTLYEYRVGARKQVLGKVHGIVIVHRELLVIHRFKGGIASRPDQFNAHLLPLCSLVSRHLNTTESVRPGFGVSPTRGAWPRSTELPSNNMRWSIGAGFIQCSSFICPLCPNALSALP